MHSLLDFFYLLFFLIKQCEEQHKESEESIEIPIQEEVLNVENTDKLVRIIETFDTTPVERYSPPTPKEKKST